MHKLYKNFIYLLFCIFFLINNSLAEYPVTSIGIIDLNYILSEASAAKDAAKQIEEIAKNIEDDILDSDQNLINEQNNLVESQAIMAPDAFEAKRIEYEKKVKNYNIERQNKLMSIDNLVNDSRNNVLDALKPILEEISNEYGITVLLEKNSVLLNAENMDITMEALKKLDKALPKIEINVD